jgi:hypothetical protein
MSDMGEKNCTKLKNAVKSIVDLYDVSDKGTHIGKNKLSRFSFSIDFLLFLIPQDYWILSRVAIFNPRRIISMVLSTLASIKNSSKRG